MDQLVALGVQALKAYKEQLDAAAEKVEIARALVKKIELLEVTVCMIPSRSNAKDIEKLKKVSTIKVSEHVERDFTAKFCRYCKHALGFAVEEMIHPSSDAVNDALDGAIMSLIPSAKSDDQEAIIGKQTPGDILNNMRKSGAKDLDITFVGMGFIIHAAITIVKNSVSVARQIQIPNVFWIIMPWKVMKQNKIGEQLITFMDAIDKYNSQLQVSISVASYAVNLEQLENALNATSMLVSEEMKIFWRKKVGISQTSIKMVELAASFMDELQDRIKAYKSQNSHIIETVSDKKFGEVMLRRIFSLMWNTNGDDLCTVYEVNEATKWFGPTADSISLTFACMKNLEMEFYKQIAFYPLGPKDPDNQNPKNKDPKDNVLVDFPKSSLPKDLRQILDDNMHPNDRVVVLEPFQRLTVVASVPAFAIDVFPYDYIALMKYNRVKNLEDLVKRKRKKPISLTEIDESRTYLKKKTNDDFFGKDVYKWNAPKTFVDFKGKQPKSKAIKLFKNWKDGNFEAVALSPKPEELEDDGDDKDENNQGKKEEITFEDIGVTKKLTLLYAPLIVAPGVYTVRLALDSLELNESDTTPGADHSKKIALSEKGYYYNRSLKVDYEVSDAALETIGVEVTGKDIFTKRFSPAYKQFLEITESEAIFSRDFKKYKKVMSSRAALRKKDDDAAKSDEKNDAEEQQQQAGIVKGKLTEKRKLVDQTTNRTINAAASKAKTTVTVPQSKEAATKLFADVSKKNKAELEKLKIDTDKLANEIKAIKDGNADKIMYLDYLLLVIKCGEDGTTISKETNAQLSFMQQNIDNDGTITGAVTTATEQLCELKKLTKGKDLDLSYNSSASLSVRLKSIQVINTILKRYRLSFDVAVLIHELGMHLDSTLQEWLTGLRSENTFFFSLYSSTSSNTLGVSTIENTAVISASTSEERLKTAENIFRHLLSIKNWYQSLLPSDLQPTIQKLKAFAENAQRGKTRAAAKADKNTASKPEQTLEEKNKRSYLVDLAKDASSLTECLTEDLFKYYCACKIGVLELDARESIFQRNFRRLELLESSMQKLFKVIEKRFLPKKAEENQDVVSTKILPNFKVNRGERETLIVQTTELIACINNYMTDTLMNKKSLGQDISKGKKCAKVITELEGIKEEAKNLPREDIPTHDEDLILVQALLPKPLGLVVVVKDVEAMVWGEKINTEANSASVGDASDVKWRPMMEGRYPYIRKTTLDIKPSTIRATHKKQDLTFAVFVNLPSEEKTNKKEENGVKTSVGKEEPQWSLIVSMGSDPDQTLHSVKLTRGESLYKLDLSHIYDGPFASDFTDKADLQKTGKNDGSNNDDGGDKEEEKEEEESIVQYIVRLVKTGSDEALGNQLILNFCEKSEDKEEDDGDDEYGGRKNYYWGDSNDYDDDDDGSDGEEDDDDSDDDYQAKAQEAYEVYDELYETIGIDCHEHPLEKRYHSVNAGKYGCDVCEKPGLDAVYHCEECGFDVHPQCAVKNFDDLHRAFRFKSYGEGEDD